MATTERDPNAPATPAEMAQLGLAVASSVASSFGPGGMAIGALLTGASSLITAANREGRDFTDAEIDSLFDVYMQARIENIRVEGEQRAT